MKYLDFHWKENLIRQTSFLRKNTSQKPGFFRIKIYVQTKGYNRACGSQFQVSWVTWFITQLKNPNNMVTTQGCHLQMTRSNGLAKIVKLKLFNTILLKKLFILPINNGTTVLKIGIYFWFLCVAILRSLDPYFPSLAHLSDLWHNWS